MGAGRAATLEGDLQQQRQGGLLKGQCAYYEEDRLQNSSTASGFSTA
jgi:hypothetical protein